MGQRLECLGVGQQVDRREAFRVVDRRLLARVRLMRRQVLALLPEFGTRMELRTGTGRAEGLQLALHTQVRPAGPLLPVQWRDEPGPNAA